MSNENDVMENKNELANAGLWDVLNELTEYPYTHETQRVMNTIGAAIDAIGIQPVDRCAHCDNVATGICDTCGASLCNEHVITTGHVAIVDGIEIPYTYCRKFTCINGLKPVGVVPYITCA